VNFSALKHVSDLQHNRAYCKTSQQGKCIKVIKLFYTCKTVYESKIQSWNLVFVVGGKIVRSGLPKLDDTCNFLTT